MGIIVLGMMVLQSCSERIDAGHEGILVKQYGSDKGVQDVVLVTGRVWYNPWTEDVIEVPTYIQTIDYEPFTVNAKDGSEFTVDPTLSFNIVPGHSPKIFTKYRKRLDEISETTILTYVKDAFRLQMNKYTTDEIVSNRELFENAVQKTLEGVLTAEGFRLEQLTSGLVYPKTIVDAVNAKNKAIQDAMRVDNEVKIAEANSKKLRVEAETKAEVLLIQARSEAEANKLKQQTLTNLLIQQQFIEKWNGSTPLYGNSPLMFKNIQ